MPDSAKLRAHLEELRDGLASLARRVGRLEETRRMADGGPVCDLADPVRDEHGDTYIPPDHVPREPSEDDSLSPLNPRALHPDDMPDEDGGRFVRLFDEPKPEPEH